MNKRLVDYEKAKKYVIFDYDDEAYISGIRKNAFQMVIKKSDALVFDNFVTAEYFLRVLKELFPDIYFRMIPLD